MENKENAFPDEVLEKVAGGADDVISVIWNCPNCKNDITLEAPESQIEMCKKLHLFACGLKPDDSGYFDKPGV